ncbi:MAG: Flp pilus assembly complex ATPase component TadA, partial [Candidatus Marinimicrobia bacterium]|nr:Flp pilus assembly complex ATPase component TadA [Candidatus Neomarinimicrobiota bacterium]
MANEKKQLGQLLLESGLISEQQVSEVLTYQREHNLVFGKAVVSMGMVQESELLKILGDHLGLPSLDITKYSIQDEALGVVSEDFARENSIIPLFVIEESLTIATADPLNIDVIDQLTRDSGMEIMLVLSSEMDIERSIDLYYRSTTSLLDTEAAGDGVRVVSREIHEDTEIVQVVDMLLFEAVNMGASDIHIEPRKNDARIRYRVDGVLQQYYSIPHESVSPMISRIKILADMDIAESRRPQDGRFHFAQKSVAVDLRCSTFPTPNGEKVVMRILDESKGKIDLHKLGFDEEILKEWRETIKIANGILLVTGPTGSGKTTTLYATLNTLNSVAVNIMTIEDPIEYSLENINQSQVNNKAGLSFSVALKTMMRQDPDIILVGEMRDTETIELAIRAALTGHLVFSTLHTNDASSTFTRLTDMGVDTCLVSSTVRAILAQRLIRLLCPRCKKPVEKSDDLMKVIGVDKWPDYTAIHEPVGCIHCRNSGYVGRSGIFELLIPNQEVKD